MKLLWRLFHSFNRRLQEFENRRAKDSFRFCGKNVFIHPTCNIIIPGRFEIGDNSSISSYTTIYSAFGVKIGANCLISSNCGISSINHIQNSTNRVCGDDGGLCRPVIIGDNVWIGMNACILPGVQIGNNSIIGSGSVVTRNVPANEIWAGNPARFLKKLAIPNAASTDCLTCEQK